MKSRNDDSLSTKTRLRNLLITLFVLIVGGIFSACAPSINPKLKNSLDATLAKSPDSKSLNSPTAMKPPALAVGQWVKTKMLDKKGNPTLMTIKIVGQEGSAFWLEQVMESYYSTSIQKMLIDVDSFGGKSPPKISIHRFIQKLDDNDKAEIEGPMLTFAEKLYRRIMQSMTIVWSADTQEDITVPAGSFKKTYKTHSKLSFGPIAYDSDIYFHSAVPINGMVKSIADEQTVELLDFGMSGATSLL